MKSSRNLLLLIGLGVLALFLINHSLGQNAAARAGQPQKLQDPHQTSTILVEAFMVWVPLSEVYDMGAPLISEGSKFASAEQVLKCLKKPNTAAVSAGAKMAVGQDEKGRANFTARRRLRSGTPEKPRFEYVDAGTQLLVTAKILSEGKVLAQLEFNHSDIEESDDPDNFGSLLTERSWSNSISLKVGKPTLVGATQDEEIAEFLIVTANIQK